MHATLRWCRSSSTAAIKLVCIVNDVCWPKDFQMIVLLSAKRFICSMMGFMVDVLKPGEEEPIFNFQCMCVPVP